MGGVAEFDLGKKNIVKRSVIIVFGIFYDSINGKQGNLRTCILFF